MRIKLDKNEVTPTLKKLEKELAGIGWSIGNIGLADILRTFKTEGSNLGSPWQELSQVTIDARRKGPKKNNSVKILRDTGQLVNSLHFKIFDDRTEIRTNRVVKGEDIAAKHHYGRGVPRRPFMELSDNAVREIKNLPSDIIRRLQ